MTPIAWISSAYNAYAGWKLYAALMVAGAALVAGAGIWHGYKVAGVRDAAFKAGRKEAEYEHQTALLEGLREGTVKPTTFK